MTCRRCKRRLAAAAGALCIACAGGVTRAGPPQPAAPATAAAIGARPPDHADQPHTPELDADAPPAGPETVIAERPVLTLDDPRRGVLDGNNIIGYCDNCPHAPAGVLCYGPCPGE